MAEFKSNFERYPKLKIEEKRLNDRVEMLLRKQDVLNAKVVRDTVQMSDPEYPYISRTASIEGIKDDADKAEMRYIKRELRQLRKQQEINDDAMDSIRRDAEKIEDEYIRAIVTYRFLRRMSWQQVAFRIGGGISPDGVRKAYQRFFQKK